MAEIQHADIPDAELHEPKGVASAVANRVYLSNGAGTGNWTKVPVATVDTGAAVLGAFLEADGSGGITQNKRLFRYTVNVGILAGIAANTTSELVINLVGAVLATDEVLQVIKPTHQAGLLLGNCRISANDQMTLQFGNLTGSTITPTASETYVVYVWRR